MSDEAQRVLVVANGHPELSKGGAELAAYSTFLALKDRDDCEAMFLGWARGRGHGTTPFATRNDDSELLFHSVMEDFFLFRIAQPRMIWRDFQQLLRSYRPTVVHFHHYIHVGLELIRAVHNTLPDARILLTLHEYLAICHNNGQMVKTNGTRLCYGGSPADCHACFPERSPGEFFMRERYIKSFFDLVDVFISPSQILMRRYEDWGIPADKIRFLENPQRAVDDEQKKEPDGAAGKQEKLRCRFGFFGQATPWKGLDVLLRALSLIPRSAGDRLHLDVHASGLEAQESEFRARIETLLEEARGRVTFHGAYEHSELGKLMADVDWVVLPSIWWENSPLVIREAFAHGRPVICSDIGGLAEKVSDGVDGMHFRCGKPHDLARVLERAATERGLWKALASRITKPENPARTIDRLWDMYVTA